MIAKGGDVQWCQSCEARAAVSYCTQWLCASCYERNHVRDSSGTLIHLSSGERPDPMTSDDRGMMAVKVQFTPDEAPLIRRPKRRRG